MLSRSRADPGDGLKAVIIIIAGLLLPIIALYGHATIVRVLGGLSVVSVVFFAIVAIIVIPKAHPSAFGHGASWGTVAIGLSIIVSGSGFGFVLQAADYSRYLSKYHTNRKVLFWATSGGGFVAETLLTLLGVVIATELTKGVDAVSGVPTLFTSWFAVPYLILIARQILAANAFALYSSGLTLQSIGLRVKRWMAVAIDTSICVVVTFIAIFSNSFYNLLSDFLLFLCAVILFALSSRLFVDSGPPAWDVRLRWPSGDKRGHRSATGWRTCCRDHLAGARYGGRLVMAQYQCLCRPTLIQDRRLRSELVGRQYRRWSDISHLGSAKS